MQTSRQLDISICGGSSFFGSSPICCLTGYHLSTIGHNSIVFLDIAKREAKCKVVAQIRFIGWSSLVSLCLCVVSNERFLLAASTIFRSQTRIRLLPMTFNAISSESPQVKRKLAAITCQARRRSYCSSLTRCQFIVNSPLGNCPKSSRKVSFWDLERLVSCGYK